MKNNTTRAGLVKQYFEAQTFFKLFYFVAVFKSNILIGPGVGKSPPGFLNYTKCKFWGSGWSVTKNNLVNFVFGTMA